MVLLLADSSDAKLRVVPGPWPYNGSVKLIAESPTVSKTFGELPYVDLTLLVLPKSAAGTL